MMTLNELSETEKKLNEQTESLHLRWAESLDKSDKLVAKVEAASYRAITTNTDASKAKVAQLREELSTLHREQLDLEAAIKVSEQKLTAAKEAIEAELRKDKCKELERLGEERLHIAEDIELAIGNLSRLIGNYKGKSSEMHFQSNSLGYNSRRFFDLKFISNYVHWKLNEHDPHNFIRPAGVFRTLMDNERDILKGELAAATAKPPKLRRVAPPAAPKPLELVYEPVPAAGIRDNEIDTDFHLPEGATRPQRYSLEAQEPQLLISQHIEQTKEEATNT